MKIMNSKITKRHLIGSFIICQLSFSVALTSCSDWDDHYEDPVTQAGSVPTLWQVMQQRSDLSDFTEVLNNTMVFKHHKKTAVSYANLLDGLQAFTVLAPVNGSFNKDSVMDLLTTDKGDSMVVRSFVGNHLSYNMVSNADSLTEFFLLNSKRVTIGKNKALDADIKEANVQARGGVMHVLNSTLPYRYNIYEILLNDTTYTKLGEQLSSYEEDEFSPTQSVEGGMVDGEQIYVDSVFIERNKMLESIGELAAEDSSYIALMPTSAEWDRVWQEAMSYYRFDSTVEGADSLQRFWANYSLLNDAVFSRTIQASYKDSLVTYSYSKRYPKYHVFHKPFEEGGILYGAKARECSNGMLYTTEKWPYTPQTTYQRELKMETERTGLILEYDPDLCTYNTAKATGDSISENEFLVITNKKSNSNWNMTFKLENTLAGTYDICAIILPRKLINSENPANPNRFQAWINYVDEKGVAQTFDCKTNFESKPERVDTVVLAENFVFPVCNYNQTNTKFSLKLKCNILARDNSKYSREMYLDCIYLRPKKNVEQ